MKKGFWLYSLVLVTSLAFMPAKNNSSETKDLFLHALTLSNDYFPIENKQLTYQSDFGDVVLRINKENQYNVFSLEGDNFLYKQKLLVNEQGVFVKEVFQKVRVFLVINQEKKFSYSELFPRIKFPLTGGKSWSWEGKEIMENETNTITLTANVVGSERIKVPAGTFETMRVETIIKSSSSSNNIVNEWYAKNIGLVKMTANLEGGGLAGTFRDILGYGELVFELK